MLKEVYRVRFECGARATMLIVATSVENATERMKAYFARTSGYERCVLTQVERVGALWEDI